MTKTSIAGATKLSPFMALAIKELQHALDPAIPANLDKQFPFEIRVVKPQGPSEGNLALEGLRTAQGSAKGGKSGGSTFRPPKSEKRLSTGQLSKLRADIQDFANKHPRGAAGVSEVLGIPVGSLYPFLASRYLGYPKTIIAAWNTLHGAPNCKACGTALDVPGAKAKPKTSRVRTPKQVEADFRRRGITIASWAHKHGVHHQIVRDLLDGKLKGHYGTAYRVAVMLKLVDGVTDDSNATERLAA